MYKVSECSKCKGKGYVIKAFRDKELTIKKFNYFFERVTCDKCVGKGIIKELIKET